MHNIISMIKKIEDKIVEWFSLDYRSLALLRISIGGIIIADLIQRGLDLYVFYSDQGVLPRSELLKYWDNKWWVSLHMASGLWEVQLFLFIIAGICALALILGYRTRLAMILSWFLLISLHSRNPLVLQGGDVIFRVITFWMMFLPLNKRWSLDRIFNRTAKPESKNTASMATVAYIVQICLVYILTGFLKTGDAWRVTGDATYYALSLEQLTRPFGHFILETVPTLLPYLTWFVLYVEMYAAILFFLPIFTPQGRLLGLGLFATLQIGFNSTMYLGLFGPIAIGVTLGMLPSYFWDVWIEKITSFFKNKSIPGLTIYYDNDCTFCAKVVSIISRVLSLHPTTALIPAHTNPSIQEIMDRENSWVVQDAQGKTYTSWSGIITVFRHSAYGKIFAPILNFFPVRMFGNHLYKWVAEQRLTVCMPEQEPKHSRIIYIIKKVSNLALFAFLLYIVLWNIDSLGKTHYINNKNDWAAWLTRMDQRFDMFAPTPLLEDGWYILPGTLTDGTQVDIFRDGIPVSYEKPERVAYKNQRWQKYMMNLWSANLSQFRDGYGKYLCREWNKVHTDEKKLQKFEIIFMVERTPPPGEPYGPIEPTTIWEHKCF